MEADGRGRAVHADEPWARAERSRLTELRLHAVERRAEARIALGPAAEAVPDLASPPRDLLFEALWSLVARAAIQVGDRTAMRRAHTQLEPATAELAGAGSGLLTLGPVSERLDALATALTPG